MLLNPVSTTTAYDVIFVGGGLANGLAAYRLNQRRPDLRVLLIEREKTLGGNHTWSFHGSDVSNEDFEWVSNFVSRSWDSYRVIFPGLSRHLNSGYHSISSEKFHRIITEALGEENFLLQKTVVRVSSKRVELNDGNIFYSRCVIDGRGWSPSWNLKCAYQNFLGQSLTFNSPHGVVEPILMDATCEQKEGFRFFYLLPWSEVSLLVEDTRYTDSPVVHAEDWRNDILRYCERKGWVIQSVDHEEIGSLPIPLESQWEKWETGLVRSGVRAGLFHATTGYSIPQAVMFSNELAALTNFESQAVFDFVECFARKFWKGQGYFRFLNRLMFLASAPDQRYRLLERFYRLPEPLIQRFYSARTTLSDQCRLLWGRPPVPIFKALQVLLTWDVPYARFGRA